MAILNITTDFAGQIGASPRIVRIKTNDTFAEITTANYLRSATKVGYTFYQNDMFCISYGTDSATTAFFTATITSTTITLDPVGGDVTLPTIANHIAMFSNTTGGITDDVATAINGGNIQAGLSGTAGYLASFPGTATTGSLKVAATANSGDYVNTITNAATGQATIWTLADPAGSASKVLQAPGSLVSGNLVKASGTAGLVADLGASLKAQTTAAYAGGGTSNVYTAAGLTASSIVVASILNSTNAVSITKVVPGTNTLTVSFSADPGASTTVSYIALSAAV